MAGIVLVCLGLVLGPAPAGAELSADAPVLRVGGLSDHPPYAVQTPEGPAGFEVELVRALGEVMGFRPEFHLDQPDGLRQAFLEGRLDLLTGVFYGEEPALPKLLTGPLELVRPALVTRRSGPVRTLAGLDLKEVLVVAGDPGTGLLLAEEPAARPVVVADAAEALRQLAAGHYDAAVVGDADQARALLAGLKLSQLQLRVLDGAARPLAFAVAPGNAGLAARLDTGLAILRANGRYQALHRHWFGAEVETGPWPRLPEALGWLGAVSAWALVVWLGVVAFRRRRRPVPVASFQAAFEGASAAILVLDGRNILDANARALEMFGHTDKGTLRQLRPVDLSPPVQPNGQNSATAAQTHLDQALQEGSASFEWLHKRRTGELFPAEVQLSALTVRGARLVHAIVRDITARKWTEAALRDSERRMSDIINLLPDPTLVIDRDGRVQFWNRAMEELTGVRAEQMLGKGEYEYAIPFYGQRRPILIDLVRLPEAEIEQKYTTIERLNGTLVGESYVPNLKGGGVYVVGTAAALHDSRGECIGAIEIVRDITERRRAEAALLESERRLAHIIDFLPDATVVIDRGGKVITWNQAMADMTGVAAVRMMGKDNHETALPFFGERRPMLIDLVLRPDPVWEATYTNFERRGDTLYGEIYATVLRGQRVYVMGAASVLRDSRGQAVGAIEIVRDLTERKRMEEAMRGAKEAAESATRAKSEFLANMSHEIRTPMNAIIGMTSLLMNTGLSAEQRELGETIRMGSDALLALINDILDFSKIEAGRMELETQPFDLRQCLESAVDMVAIRAGEKGLELGCLIEDGTPPTIHGDVTRLRQILVNLLNNAIKFTERGEVIMRVAMIAPATAGSPAALRFTVHDTGIGIPSDRMDRLFKSFSQVDASTTRRYGGTGLGLAISSRLAEIMGGRMWVESSGIPGQGSRFHFTIRAAVSAEHLEQQLPDDLPELAGKRVMIVDDNQTNGLILTRQTEGWGMAPETFESPHEALDTIRHGVPFELAILDMQMPDMDGLQLAREIRRLRDPESLPLIMLTSLGHRETGIEDIGFAAFLNKPIKSASLHDALRLALGAQGSLPPRSRPSDDPGFDSGLAQRHPLRILVAEDYAINQKVALYTLGKMGYRADLAENGREVLEALRRQAYDVILMDVQMPEMDGLETTRHIIETCGPYRRPRIIAVTANAMQGDREECLAAGMDDFVTKPVQVAALQAALLRCPRRADPPPSAQARSPLDRAMLLEFFPDLVHGDTAIFSEMVAMLQEDVPQRLDQLTAAVASGQAGQVHAISHTLKSASRSFGAVRFSQLCQTMESEARAGRVPDAAAVAGLAAEFARVSEALVHEMASSSPP